MTASNKQPNVFISWSGARSKHVATALSSWLPAVLQSAKPWLSNLSIDKGARPLEEISKALDSIEVGISCLTLENLKEPWILYEAGALSKRIGQKSRLCTYLLGGLTPEGVPPPLGMFQHTRAEKEETRQMLRSINVAISEEPVVEATLDLIFERMWVDLEKAIENMPEPGKDLPEARKLEDMVGEILDIVRAEDNRNKMSDWQTRLQQSLYPNIASIARAAVSAKLRITLPFSAWMNSDPFCPSCKSGAILVAADGSKECKACGVMSDVPEDPSSTIESK